jgi:hypothetical protein
MKEIKLTVYNGILGVIADDDEEASFLLLEPIAHERRDARIAARSAQVSKLNT